MPIQNERDHFGHRATRVALDGQVALQLELPWWVEQLEADEIAGRSRWRVPNRVARKPTFSALHYQRAQTARDGLACRAEIGAKRVGRARL